MAFSVNGCGKRYLGKRDYWSDGSYITTEWITVFWFPLVPLRSMRVWLQDSSGNELWGDANYIVEKSSSWWLNVKQVAFTYLFVAVFFLNITALEDFYSLPPPFALGFERRPLGDP